MKRAEARINAARALAALGTVCVLLWCPHALALDPSLDVSQYAHTAWTYREGLQGAIYTIAQTPDGYLWLGTQSGVVRFDGVRAVPLPLAPGQQLTNTAAAALLSSPDGTLWNGTLYGLVSWKNGQVTEYPALAHRTILALLRDRDGTVWVGGGGRRESFAPSAAEAPPVLAMTEASAPQWQPCMRIATAVCGWERRQGYGDGGPVLQPVI